MSIKKNSCCIKDNFFTLDITMVLIINFSVGLFLYFKRIFEKNYFYFYFFKINFFSVFKSFWYADVKNYFLKNKKLLFWSIS